MNENYQQLIKVLDSISAAAPSQMVRYHPDSSNADLVNKSRSLALIHLWLQVKFGILDFQDREEYVTDGTADGGIDAYFIDRNSRRICFLQSKFRATAENFEEKEIRFEELVAMDASRITRGEVVSDSGEKYNGKILKLIQEIRNITDIARYDFHIYIMANIKPVSPERLRQLCGGFPITVIDFQKCYEEFVFPLITGTFYNEPDLTVFLDLSQKQSGTKIDYSVDTRFGQANITVVFMPTMEIATFMHKYRNAILKYNPRCYLDLEKGNINKDIRNTVVNYATNEFAIYNNGITILSTSTSINERIGQKGLAQLMLQNPQIINGGQSAFTLSRILQEGADSAEKLNGKEILVKIITVNNYSEEFIEELSIATNQQNIIEYSDRRANDTIQIELQKQLFMQHGILYERKRGEFADAVKSGLVSESRIITRTELLRISRALNNDYARKQSAKRFFKDDSQYRLHYDMKKIAEYAFGFKALQALRNIYDIKKKSHALSRLLRHTPYFLVYLVSIVAKDWSRVTVAELEEIMLKIAEKWPDFENFAFERSENSKYRFKVHDKFQNKEVVKFNFRGYFRSEDFKVDASQFDFVS